MTQCDHFNPTYLERLGSLLSFYLCRVQGGMIKPCFHTRTELDAWTAISTFDRCGYSPQSFLHCSHGGFHASSSLEVQHKHHPHRKFCLNRLHPTPSAVATLEEHILSLTLHSNFLFACLLDDYSPMKARPQLENKEKKNERGGKEEGRQTKGLFKII